MSGPIERLCVRNVRKSFDRVEVLRGVSLDISAGQVHALLGENGSGKSTLVKILSGYHSYDSGDITLDDLDLGHALEARRVTVIHQDLGLVDTLSVLDNIAVGQRYGGPLFAPIRERSLRRQVEVTLASLDSPIDLDCPVGQLTPPQRSQVAVARALTSLGASELSQSLFILDEPTALLTSEQASGIVALMRQMAAAGAAILFVSHRLSEAKAAADHITVLRDGAVVATGSAASLSEQDLIAAMLGRRMGTYYPDKLAHRPAEAALQAHELCGEIVRDVDLTLRAGEIVGVAGLPGMGQDELPGLLCAAVARRSGGVYAGNPRRAISSYRSALAAGIALVPSDRRRDGGWTKASAAENLSLPILHSFRRGLRIDSRGELANASKQMKRTGVVPPSPSAEFGTFSGGNQQKIVLAKWLQREPRVLLLHEPTQGVDVGARRDLIQLINAAAAAGTAVLIASNDFEQLAEVCQRVLVLHDGRIEHELLGDDVTEQAIATAVYFAASTSKTTQHHMMEKEKQ